MPAVSAETRNAIAQRIKAGDAIALIAQDLGLSRATVYKYAPEVEDWLQWTSSKSRAISRLAYEKLERAMSGGDARLALDWLKAKDFAAQSEHLHVHGDVSLVQAIGYVPSASTPSPAVATSTPMLTSSTERTSQAVLAEPSAATEAPAKNRLDSIALASHENFSQISDSTLVAELERRGFHVVAKPIEATDAEVIESNG